MKFPSCCKFSTPLWPFVMSGTTTVVGSFDWAVLFDPLTLGFHLCAHFTEEMLATMICKQGYMSLLIFLRHNPHQQC